MSSTCGPGYNTYWSDSPTVLNTISSSMDSISMGNHTSMIWELQAQALPKLHENTCRSIALVPWPHSLASFPGSHFRNEGLGTRLLVPRLLRYPDFDHLQYANTEVKASVIWPRV